jgi:hypothetical protein
LPSLLQCMVSRLKYKKKANENIRLDWSSSREHALSFKFGLAEFSQVLLPRSLLLAARDIRLSPTLHDISVAAPVYYHWTIDIVCPIARVRSVQFFY